MSIFICYRRSDLGDAVTGRLQDWLQRSFPHVPIIRDVDHIPPGVDFAEHLRSALASCKVLVVVIGPDWSVPRLWQSDDFVRMEIELALHRGATVMPVFLAGTTVPQPSELPPSIGALFHRPAYSLRWPKHEFAEDMRAIEAALTPLLGRPRRSHRWLIAALVVAGLLVGVGTAAAAALWVAPRVLEYVAAGKGSPSADAGPSPSTPPRDLDPKQEVPDAGPDAVAPSEDKTAPQRSPASGKPAPPDPELQTARAECLDSTVCKEIGLCTAIKNDTARVTKYVCIATSDVDCRKTTESCPIHGQCSVGDRRCVAKSDADCKRAQACTTEGLCTASGEFCRATSDADCRSSDRCRLEGECTAKGNKCVAGSDADCRQAENPCRRHGKCTAKNGVCIATSRADCVATLDCKERGRCTPMNGACHPGSNEDCLASNRCTSDALCSFEAAGSSPSCMIKSKADCRRWVQCKSLGKCSWSGRDGFTAFNECFPGSDEDCRRSTGCKEGGRCAVDKVDPKSCSAPLPAIVDDPAP